ncbi:MAG TPA: UDP-N-acetylglucosamine 1-carboxyvinyltransferase [Cyanobacteria bacterium UBA11149]|nr:UDP-N-acetylglucosamine 1-carboxyvinyltransferase [Cyanobacteria bacterium UBA11366]HBK65189.1 UDP-N-acetylglucosamine 1-carboxyvinyltransferase [Cyanobacteria bacterium UBA11166]HBR74699.1 UDP-N-acetylglucosamine 1-carboxyvinyltransferase [Cyanobacteria bacterium UBA11159]HBS72463.1 UDP-N-acetylglucosamine 1-carboxyvinyltransferase [Cyanobacteria bacterium UBA11153]HBW91197.1 UDP-N-acetylglucosamine 1-carboxyvinyltransferase [Cyanobacteria bacterium UBA11149]HCA95641.1 UDP-N-acetylglucosam
MKDNHSAPAAQESVLEIWGRASLKGHVKISGAKNSALAIMAGSLLCPEDCRLRNVPSLVDIGMMGEILSALGVKLERIDDTLEIDARHLNGSTAPYELVSKLRASFFALGPLLARLGEVRIPLPGGCAIGARPVDLHVRGLQAMGAEVHIEHGVVHAFIKGTGSKRLKGTKIYLDYPSVGATETIMMAATLAEGETIIENAAREPEITDLAGFCRAMGAQIRGDGTNTIIVNGVPSLHAVDYPVIPDRIEAGTFLVAGAITQSELLISPVVSDHLIPVIAKLNEMGCQVIAEDANSLRIIPGHLRATDIETLPYPGFPTDMQAPFVALLTLAEGNSAIAETVFENRFGHVPELNRMGADIRVKNNIALVRGVPILSGAPVMATDLRASAALVLAGLAADGKTTIRGLHHLDRGYENLEDKLRLLGAKLHRVPADAETEEDNTSVVENQLAQVAQ